MTVSRGKKLGVGNAYYDIRCLSADTKPTKMVTNGSTLIEIDTGKSFIFDASTRTWKEISHGGGGGGGGDVDVTPIPIDKIHEITGM